MTDSDEKDVLPLSTSDPTQPVKIRMGTTGVAALPPRTVMQYWDRICSKYGDKPALFQKRPGPAVRFQGFSFDASVPCCVARTKHHMSEQAHSSAGGGKAPDTLTSGFS
jgi:hypothetical protein